MNLKILLLCGCAAALAFSQTACAILGAKPAELAPVIDAMARAGCTGDFSFSAGAGSAAGLSPGSFHADNSFKGGCDPRNAPAPSVLTLKDIQTVVQQALAQERAAQLAAQTAPATPSTAPSK